MIDTTIDYETKNGLKVRIYATDGKGHRPVHGAIYQEEVWVPINWCNDGSYHQSSSSKFDLVPAPQEFKIWVNEYKSGRTLHQTKDDADHFARTAAHFVRQFQCLVREVQMNDPSCPWCGSNTWEERTIANGLILKTCENCGYKRTTFGATLSSYEQGSFLPPGNALRQRTNDLTFGNTCQ
jgi:predicted nucleic-acid-binding Zn-ribbon protein